jgi:hypothetical protein
MSRMRSDYDDDQDWARGAGAVSKLSKDGKSSAPGSSQTTTSSVVHAW